MTEIFLSEFKCRIVLVQKRLMQDIDEYFKDFPILDLFDSPEQWSRLFFDSVTLDSNDMMLSDLLSFSNAQVAMQL